MRNRSEEQDEADIDEEVVSLNAGYVYWSEGHISRRRLDGQGSEQRIGEGWANAVDLFVDIDGGKIYWLNSKEYPSGGFIGLVRADLDGENPELLAEPDSAYMRNLVVDLDGNAVYWYQYGDGHGSGVGRQKILKARLDGSQRTVIHTIEPVMVDLGSRNERRPIEVYSQGMAFDHDENLLYWTQSDDLSLGINRLNKIDSENNNTFIDFPHHAKNLNIHSGKLYFSKWEYVGSQWDASIWSSYLDGTGAEMILDQSGIERGLHLNKKTERLYWVSFTPAIYGLPGSRTPEKWTLHRARLDGSQQENLMDLKTSSIFVAIP